MTKYILLLRGINVGGKNRLPMKDLRTLLESAGFQNVRTYIQSGNVVLTAPQNPASRISEGIREQFGFEPAVLALTEEQFRDAAAKNPYPDFEGKTVHFFFCRSAAKLDTEKTEKLAASSESYRFLDGVFYLHAPDGVGRSKLAAKVDACVGVETTGRNLNTVRRLLEMLGD